MSEPFASSELKSAAPEPAGKGTSYVLLTFDPKTDNWFEAGDRVTASSANEAIRQHSQTYAEGPTITYVAVPERSWKPVKVTVSQETVVKLGGA